ncbi:MAG: hypothetical protein V5A34_01845 [Halapricum sp.]
MADRVPSDHETVSTYRVTLATVGRTGRPRIELPEDVHVQEDEIVRLSFDGGEYHARVETSLDGTSVLNGAFDNARLARSDEGEDRLTEWIAGTDVEPRRSLLLDVLTEGYHYGLREPGERVVYTVREPPDSSLTDIAQSLEE